MKNNNIVCYTWENPQTFFIRFYNKNTDVFKNKVTLLGLENRGDRIWWQGDIREHLHN